MGGRNSFKKLVFPRVTVKRQEKRKTRPKASATWPPIFLAAALDLGFSPSQLDPEVRVWVQGAERSEGSLSASTKVKSPGNSL